CFILERCLSNQAHIRLFQATRIPTPIPVGDAKVALEFIRLPLMNTVKPLEQFTWLYHDKIRSLVHESREDKDPISCTRLFDLLSY
ncbi:MAG: hypothetical protein WBW31_06640, partial [Candidatus Sulfotelmatobacter sp.]